MPYDAKALANYFLDLADRDRRPVDPLKLQKLVYFAHGWNLALRDRPLLDEQVEAWPYGPVIPSLYHEFKPFGNKPVSGRAMAIDWSGDDDAGHVTYPNVDGPDSAVTRQLLDRIWEVYGGMTAIQLSNMTHERGTPWDRVWKEYDGELPRGTDIPSATIKDYFRDLGREKAMAS